MEQERGTQTLGYWVQGTLLTSNLFSGSGSIPNICPHCNAKDRWDWGDTDYGDDINWQVVECLECGTVFHEIYVLTRWEKIKLK